MHLGFLKCLSCIMASSLADCSPATLSAMLRLCHMLPPCNCLPVANSASVSTNLIRNFSSKSTKGNATKAPIMRVIIYTQCYSPKGIPGRGHRLHILFIGAKPLHTAAGVTCKALMLPHPMAQAPILSLLRTGRSRPLLDPPWTTQLSSLSGLQPLMPVVWALPVPP